MRQVYVIRELETEAARRRSAFIDLSTQPRGICFPLKRSTFSDRETPGNGKYHGDDLEYTAQEAIQSSYRCKSDQFRSFKGEKIDGSFCKSNLDFYKIAIIVIGICFLAVTVMQASVMFLVKHTDFLTAPGSKLSTVPETSRILFDEDGISDCERAVSIAVRIFTKNLLRTNLPEVFKLERNPGHRPRLALICPDLEEVPYALYMSTISRGLQWLGYDLELYAHRDGRFRTVWEDIGVPVQFVEEDWQNITVDWSIFEGVLAVSLDAKKIIESLAQEPFTDIPVIWIIQENVVLDQGIAWNSSVELQTVYSSWLETFNRSTVIVFPNYFLPFVYNDFYNGRFYVIAGSPSHVWEASQYMMTHTRLELRAKIGLRPEDYVVVVVGSTCASKEIWREHAIVMNAVANLNSSSATKQDDMLGGVKLFFLGHRNRNSGYLDVLQLMARHFGLQDCEVKLVGFDEDVQGLLWIADLLVYSSVWEELSFPPIVIQAMNFERPVIVPDIRVIRQQIRDGHSGFLFAAGDDQALAQVLLRVRSNPVLARKVALEGASLARNLLAKDVVVRYGYLLEKLLDFPEKSQLQRPAADLQDWTPQGWRWDILSEPVTVLGNSTTKDLLYLKSFTDLRFVDNDSGKDDLEFDEDFDWPSENDWDQEKQTMASETLEEVEDDLAKDRLDMIRSSFEEVNKMVKKTETRVSQDKHHEIDHLEVERVAQPLCIYEPYHGSGASSFLHKNHLLYHGLSLSAGGRRPYLDDVDGASRLRLLNDSYYRDVLCDVAGFFAIGTLIDRVHRNPWIGFQPWRAVSRKVGLSERGEAALLTAISGEADGDALYFWAQMEKDSKPVHDFWFSCNLANAGKCRTVFLDTFKYMYGLPSSWTQLPPMPADGGTWSALNCWAMPTTSFVEFVMFSRMFVDALDALQYEDHHNRGICCFSSSRVEVKHCYCNFLEGLVNVWAYHSARRMVYIDPDSGLMREQHNLEGRIGTMWVKWFRRSLLKSMDEDLAEEADEEQSNRRWVWPQTGEVFWVGTKDKERREKYEVKVEKKRRQLERLARQTKYRQRPIGKYIKPKGAKPPVRKAGMPERVSQRIIS